MKLTDEDKKKLLELFKKYQTDPEFRQTLIKDANSALKEFHLSFLEGKDVKILENTKTDFHLAIPKNPIPDKLRVPELPPNPKIPAIALWIIHQFKTGSKLKDELLTKPEEVLKNHKINLPKGLKIHIHQNTDKLVYFVLPRKLEEGEQLSEEELELVSGGKGKGGGLLAKGGKGGADGVASEWPEGFGDVPEDFLGFSDFL